MLTLSQYAGMEGNLHEQAHNPYTPVAKPYRTKMPIFKSS